MPRHRMEAPRTRTLWPAAARSARRVQFHAAGRRASPGHARPSAAPEWRQRLTRTQRRMLKQAGRRLLVSPWFAAGAGVVIAAGALAYAPHAHFAIGISQCGTAGGASCKQLTQQGVPPALLGPGDQMTPSPSPASTPARTILYQVMSSSSRYGFIILIKFQAAPARWRLSFVIPGASDVYVEGGLRSQPNGPDGLTVISNYAATESAGYVAISGYQAEGSSELSAGGDVVQFQVRGTGAPSTPSSCSFSGNPCQFKASHDLATGVWPSSG